MSDERALIESMADGGCLFHYESAESSAEPKPTPFTKERMMELLSMAANRSDDPVLATFEAGVRNGLKAGERAKHAPGPWEVGGEYQDEVWSADGSCLCTVRQGDDAEANALLMAAAPDLLMACKALVAALERGAVSGRLVDEVREVIAKADW